MSSVDRSCATVPMRFWLEDDYMPLVTVQIGGTPEDVSLDTGSSGALKLFPEAAQRLGLDDRIVPSDTLSVHGARGSATLQRVVLPEVRFGPLVLTELDASIGQRNEGELPVRMGNMGNRMLLGGVLWLDYPGRSISICDH